MDSYIQTSLPSRTPQSLDVTIAGRTFRFSLLLLKTDSVMEGTGRQRVREHRHDLYHMVLYTRGKNQISFKGRRHAARRSTFLFTAPGEAHELNPMRPGELSYSEIKFAFASSDGETLRLPCHELLSLHAGVELAARAFPTELTPPQFREFEGFLERTLYWLRTPGTLSMAFAAQVIHALFVFLIREVFRPREEPNDPLSLAILHAREHIDCHYHRPLTLAELAGMAGFSEGYFLRSFKRIVGLSPIAYQRQLRIGAARTLLRSTNLECKEIAAQVGFGDVCQFSKAFKKATGLSPRRHRAGAGE